jgi:hypothetical protein
MCYQHKVILLRVLKSELEEDVAKRCCQSLEQKKVGRTDLQKKEGKVQKRPFGHIVDLRWPLAMFHLVLWLLGFPDKVNHNLFREKKKVKLTHLIEQVIL